MLGAVLNAADYVTRLQSELAKINQADLHRWSDLIYQAWERERFVYIFGNGGSGTTASHMSEDLGKSSLAPEDLRDESKKRVREFATKAGAQLAVGHCPPTHTLHVRLALLFLHLR